MFRKSKLAVISRENGIKADERMRYAEAIGCMAVAERKDW
jgi:hypothetical protein